MKNSYIILLLDGIMMGYSDYEKILDRREPLDKLILELVNNGELDIGFVKVNSDKDNKLNKYSQDSIIHRGKHTS
jgi:hypothetical protein